MTAPKVAIAKLAGPLHDFPGELASLPAITPDQLAPVIIATSEQDREMHLMRWGFPPAPGRGGQRPHSNIRSPFSTWWRPWFSKCEHRCLVPATSFCKLDHRSCPPEPIWFALHETRPVFFFAGIWRVWQGMRGYRSVPVYGHHYLFSILTAQSGAIIKAMNCKDAPVILTSEEAQNIWLTAPVERALSLQNAAPEGALRIVARGQMQDMMSGECANSASQ